MKDSINLKVPSKPEYMSVIRLTASAISNNIGFSIDDIEDIKICISEVCGHGIDRLETLDIDFNILDNGLGILVKNTDDIEVDSSDQALKMSILIIESLMDKVSLTDKGVEIVKYTEDDLR